jgi:hypothetical protein
MAAAEESDEGEANLVMLADDHSLDVGEDLLSGLLKGRHLAPQWHRRSGHPAMGFVG